MSVLPSTCAGGAGVPTAATARVDRYSAAVVGAGAAGADADRAFAPGQPHRRAVALRWLSCAFAAVAAFASIDYAQQAWLVLPVSFVLLGLLSLRDRLRHRPGRVGGASRALLAAPPVLLLPHLPLVVPDLPGDLGVPKAVLLLIPGGAAVLLAARAWLLPGTRLLAARLTGAGVLSFLLGLNLLTYYDVMPAADAVVEVQMPVPSEWIALQAGRSLLTNHHTLHDDQNYAVDLVRRLPGGTTHSGDKRRLSSYAAFGQPIVSPVTGTVVEVVSDLPDQAIGRSDRTRLTGNHVVIRVAPDRFVLLAHLQTRSVVVHSGQSVTAGTRLARVGNSGNTSEPHLHIQAMTKPGRGRPLRLRFVDVRLVRHGNVQVVDGVELRRNDRVRAA